MSLDFDNITEWFEAQTINIEFVRHIFRQEEFGFDLEKMEHLLNLFKPYKVTFELAIRDTWIKPILDDHQSPVPLDFLEFFLSAKLITVAYVEQHFPFEIFLEQASSYSPKECLRMAMLLGAAGGIYSESFLRRTIRASARNAAYDELMIKFYKEGTHLFVVRRYGCGKPKKFDEDIWGLILDFIPYALFSEDDEKLIPKPFGKQRTSNYRGPRRRPLDL